MDLFVSVMGTKRNNGNQDLRIVNFVNHTILLVDTPRPCLFKHKMLEMFHLSSSSTRMLLQFKQQLGYLLYRGLIAAPLDGGKFGFCFFREKNNVSHLLQGIDQLHDVFFGLETGKLCVRLMGICNIFLNSLYVAQIGKERVTRRADFVWVSMIRWLQQLVSQPLTIFLRKRQSLDIGPQIVQCKCCHKPIIE